MERVADGLHRISVLREHAVNVYVLGDVLVDAGMKGSGKKLPRLLEGHPIGVHAITHAHGDHVGGSRAVCDALGIPFWAPAGDADAAERGKQVLAASRLRPLMAAMNGFPRVDVARRLREGDEVGGFRVVETPGHSPGHVAFFRESDRALVAGDVWFNMSLLTLRPGLRPPPDALTPDPEENRRSMRKLADLEPDVVCFGHGPVLRHAAPKLRAFVDRLYAAKSVSAG